jgi:hypothetical protein
LVGASFMVLARGKGSEKQMTEAAMKNVIAFFSG